MVVLPMGSGREAKFHLADVDRLGFGDRKAVCG
jgi:hypothetical protein